MTKKNTAKEFSDLLKRSNNIVITTHWNPDGDAIGSSMALFHFLKSLKKNVHVIIPNSFPDFLNWIPGIKSAIDFQKQERKAEKIIHNADLIFTLDFNTFKRLEKLGKILEKNPVPKVLIDHHRQPDNYAKYFFFDIKACSTCELIFEFIDLLGKKKLIDKKIASCIYTGIMTDTGSFRFRGVSPKTHLIISELLKTGIIPSDIHEEIYDSYSYERIKLLGYALNEKLKIIPGNDVAYFLLSEKDLDRFNYQKGDLEGVVNYPFSIKGIKVCALFNESDGFVKVSLRSKGKIDVNEFARKYFNGGGHINAAGGKSFVSINETEKLFVQKVKEII